MVWRLIYGHGGVSRIVQNVFVVYCIPSFPLWIPTTRDKINLNLVFVFFKFKQKFEGIQAILSVALDWAGFFMSIGLEIIPKYGLEVGWMIFWGVENIFRLELMFLKGIIQFRFDGPLSIRAGKSI